MLGAVMSREPLGDELPEDQRDERQPEHERSERKGLGDGGQAWPGSCENRREFFDELLAAVGRRQGADERDPDLNRGQEAVGVGGEVEGSASRRITRIRERPEAAAAAGNDRHFGSREEAVGRHQRENNHEFREHGRARVRFIRVQ